MDRSYSSTNSSIEISESNNYAFDQLEEIYSTLNEMLKPVLNIYSIPLLQKSLRDFHTDLWSALNLSKEKLLPLKSETLSELEGIIVNLFIFGEDELGPVLDFESLKDIKSSYLINSIRQVLIKYLNLLESFIINNSVQTKLPTVKINLLPSGELPIPVHKWQVLKPVRISVEP
ncbi:MAG: hypothetical protein ABIM99_02745 [Candidatus Dojkabacteria bacterium]